MPYAHPDSPWTCQGAELAKSLTCEWEEGGTGKLGVLRGNHGPYRKVKGVWPLYLGLRLVQPLAVWKRPRISWSEGT